MGKIAHFFIDVHIFPTDLVSFSTYILSSVMKNFFITYDLTLGERVRLERLSRNWRQIDLASKAGVQLADITALEKDRFLSKNRKRKILLALGLSEADNA